MPIPKSRNDLIEQIETSYSKLDTLLDEITDETAGAICVEDWTVKELLAVRCWWSETVVDWIESGRNGEIPDLPAKRYKWHETPQLNNEIAKSSTFESFEEVRNRLNKAYHQVLKIIGKLSDEELLNQGVFEWAGKWPLSRWLSINTARQYTTAQKYIRQVLRRSE